MQKAVNAKAKLGLKSSAIVQDLDARCPKGYRSSYNTSSKVQTQDLTTKESKLKEFKPQESKLANGRSSISFCTNKLFQPNYKNKRWKWLKKKNSTLTTENNAIEG